MQMIYSIMADGVVKYAAGFIKVGLVSGACFLSYGFGILHGEKSCILRAHTD